MKINNCLKVYMKETHRSMNLIDTYKNIKSLVDIIGVTRVADLTNLDRIGIPVFSCIRPEAKIGAISVYNGKGYTKQAAEVSAIMESIERYSAEKININTIGKYSILKSNNNILNPNDLILPQFTNFDSNIPWSKGYEINPITLECDQILIPSNAIFHPIDKKYNCLFRTNTNGLASGNTIEEALFHGICEVIERDSWSIVEYSQNAGSIITDINDREINFLIEKFNNAGINIILRNITSDIGITTIAAISDDILMKDPTLLCLGMGTHTSPKIAMIRALTEVAQSRITQIHGAREDTVIADLKKKIGYERTKKLNKKWFDNNSVCKYSDLKDKSTNDFKIEIKNILNELSINNISRVLFYDLTDKIIKIPVVRVIIPNLECYSIDSERLDVNVKKEMIFMINTTIFLGPSLKISEAKKYIKNVTFKKPIKRGDIINEIKTNTKVIGIIDGVFYENASVCHKEILSALNLNIKIFGSSSMGALRACEMERYGMIGVGKVFEQYKYNIINSDDEVAVLYDPLNNTQLTEALVDIRETLKLAINNKIIDIIDYKIIIKNIKKIHYSNRNYKYIFNILKNILSKQKIIDIKNWIENGNIINIKKIDCIKLLVHINNIINKNE